MEDKKKVTRKIGQVRIIAGIWRGRRIKFPESLPVRPTADRIRETLFNWLTPQIRGAWCLDLFAGTGSLGFEALSRGASRLTFIDQSKEVISHLKKTALELGRRDIEIMQTRLPDPTLKFRTPFDIIFLDPPFYRGLVESCIPWLVSRNCFNPGALIYIEYEKNAAPFTIPSNWRQLQSKAAGIVKYELYQLIG